MSRTYKATGINLKTMPLGEADRILTILTPEFGMVRAVAMGARKQNSKLGGRSGLFVVNQLLLAKGRSLDKITQAETLESYAGLCRNLQKLTAGQYLAELALQQALSEQPQTDLFYLFTEHLSRIERSPDWAVFPRLVHAIFQLLALAGVAPQVHQCCVTQTLLTPDPNTPDWCIGFSAKAGGTITREVLASLQAQDQSRIAYPSASAQQTLSITPAPRLSPRSRQHDASLHTSINALDLAILQELAVSEPEILNIPQSSTVWFGLEKILRHYTQYHFDCLIRSAHLIDSCFTTAPTSP